MHISTRNTGQQIIKFVGQAAGDAGEGIKILGLPHVSFKIGLFLFKNRASKTFAGNGHKECRQRGTEFRGDSFHAEVTNEDKGWKSIQAFIWSMPESIRFHRRV